MSILGRVDLLNLQDVRHWIEKHAIPDLPAQYNGELLIREAMKDAWLAGTKTSHPKLKMSSETSPDRASLNWII
jgi:hypothetical protein